MVGTGEFDLRTRSGKVVRTEIETRRWRAWRWLVFGRCHFLIELSRMIPQTHGSLRSNSPKIHG
jgi:hypothetical protein